MNKWKFDESKCGCYLGIECIGCALTANQRFWIVGWINCLDVQMNQKAIDFEQVNNQLNLSGNHFIKVIHKKKQKTKFPEIDKCCVQNNANGLNQFVDSNSVHLNSFMQWNTFSSAHQILHNRWKRNTSVKWINAPVESRAREEERDTSLIFCWYSKSNLESRMIELPYRLRPMTNINIM